MNKSHLVAIRLTVGNVKYRGGAEIALSYFYYIK